MLLASYCGQSILGKYIRNCYSDSYKFEFSIIPTKLFHLKESVQKYEVNSDEDCAHIRVTKNLVFFIGCQFHYIDSLLSKSGHSFLYKRNIPIYNT